MRQALENLIKKTIILKYELPCETKGLDKTKISTEEDKCYSVTNIEDFVDVIYNSIIEYSLNERDIEKDDYNKSMNIAIKTKIRENPKISHGFFGETLLDSLLRVYYGTDALIARGYFYNPTAKNEVTGFDSYHIIEKEGETELWWGEVKFRPQHSTSITEVLKKIEYTFSDKYLNDNVLAFENHKYNLNTQGSIIEQILKDFNDNPEVNIANKLKKYNATLVYPILIVYNEKDGYDESIRKILSYIEKLYNDENINFDCSLRYKIFFMFLPIKDVKQVKEKVIECVKIKKPVIL